MGFRRRGLRDKPDAKRLVNTFVQVPFGSIKGNYLQSAVIRLDPEQLSVRHSIEWTQYVEDGLGPAVGAAFKASNGQYFGVGQLLHYRNQGQHGCGIQTLFESPAEAQTLECGFCDLGITSADIVWIREDLQLPAYDLIRQDDHGNQFLVGTYPLRADALDAQRKISAGVHKQDSWIQAHQPANQRQ